MDTAVCPLCGQTFEFEWWPTDAKETDIRFGARFCDRCYKFYFAYVTMQFSLRLTKPYAKKSYPSCKMRVRPVLEKHWYGEED